MTLSLEVALLIRAALLLVLVLLLERYSRRRQARLEKERNGCASER